MLLAILLAPAAFAALCAAADAGSSAARVAAIVQAGLTLPYVGFVFLDALAMLLLRCDETCDESLLRAYRSGHWWHAASAWQWWVQALLALGAFAAVVFTLVVVARRRYPHGAVGFALAAACFGAWVAMIAPLGSTA